MVKYDDVIQSHTMSKDEFKIQKDEEEKLEDKLMEDICNNLQAIRDMVKKMKPSAEYRRISTIAAANSALNHIRDEVCELAHYDLGKYNYELTETPTDSWRTSSSATGSSVRPKRISARNATRGSTG